VDLEEGQKYLFNNTEINSNKVFKGIVQRDLTGAETRLKRSVLFRYRVGKFSENFKGTPS
jgi:hypothetical protein